MYMTVCLVALFTCFRQPWSAFSTRCAAVQLRHASTSICILCSPTQHSVKRETTSNETVTHLCVVNLLTYWFLLSAQNISVNSSSLYQNDCKNCFGIYYICCLVNSQQMTFYMPLSGVGYYTRSVWQWKILQQLCNVRHLSSSSMRYYISYKIFYYQFLSKTCW